MVHAAQGNKKSSSDLIEEILKTDNLPGDVASPLYSQEREISSSSTSYDWGCINYGSAGCIYGIKANTDPCICRMGIE